MARRGTRRNLGYPGLWADDGGYSAVVKVGKQQREQRFTPTGHDPESFQHDITVMLRWQLHTRAELLGTSPTKAPRDTLAAAVPRFLATMPAGSSARRDHEKLLATWLATPLGGKPRHAIRKSHVLTQCAQWAAEGYAAATLNHRVRSLRALFDVLDADDDDAVNPCAKVKRFPEPEPEERGADYAILEGIIACIPDIGFTKTAGSKRPPYNKSKIRLRVMAWTGLPPALVKKIRPEHIRWAERELDVQPRRKGKGVKARRLPLLDEAVAALRDMASAGAFGTYSNAAPWCAWDRAKRRYLAKLRQSATGDIGAIERIVTPLRPYDLRHSFAAMVYEETDGNREAVTNLLIHSNPSMADRYVKRAVIQVSRAALDAVAVARGQAQGPSSVPAGASAGQHTIAFSGTKRKVSPVSAKSLKRAKPSNSVRKTAV